MKNWWKEAVGYQIYIKSFYDSNNDGIGDINGILQKLEYIKNLGVNLIWITPFYSSPMVDNGYDVSNFYRISRVYGNIKQLKNLINNAHKLDIKVIIDLVLNHTSNKHKWFIESMKSVDNYYNNYYIWEYPKYNNLVKEPTNWLGFFSESCWKYNKKLNMYYFSTFTHKMPDLNWENKNLRNDMYKMINYYINLGVDGFRVDAASHLAKDEFVNSNMSNTYVCDMYKFSNLDKTLVYLNYIKDNCFKNKDLLIIGETGGGASIDMAYKYANNNDSPMNMVFNFDHNWCFDDNQKFDLVKYKKTWKRWLDKFNKNSWIPLNFLNHDQPRLISHYCDNSYLKNKCLSTFLYFLRGTPFIYNGEEIGMQNIEINDISEIRDISCLNVLSKKDVITKKDLNHTRDLSRGYMLWDNNKYSSFSTSIPWIKSNPTTSIYDQEYDNSSLLSYYKKIFKIRKEYSNILIYGNINIKDIENKNIFYYTRDDKITILGNYSDNNIEYILDNKILNILLNTHTDIEILDNSVILKPYQAIVYINF